MEKKKIQLHKKSWKECNTKTPAITCHRCSYSWKYSKGIPRYRIRCPRCHSAKNSLNREIFGLWRP